MAGEAQDAVWPLPKFYFTVSLGSQDSTVSFQEVSGLDTETQPSMTIISGNGMTPLK